MANPTRPTTDMFRTPSMDDDEAPLLIPQSENDDDTKPPALKFFFSLVTVFRVVNFAMSITATVLLSDSRGEQATAAFFCVLSTLVTVWNTFGIIDSCSHNSKKRKCEIAIGSFVCSCTRTNGRSGNPGNPANAPFNKRHNYLVNIVDFGLCLIMIIPTAVAFKTDVYRWWERATVGAVCATVLAVQGVISFLGLFSIFRKVKICIYTAEDEKAAYRIAESYSDRCPVVANV